MADGKRPHKGGKRPETNTPYEIPDDIYEEYCTPNEAKHGKENKISARCAFSRLNADGQENGGNIVMSLPSA